MPVIAMGAGALLGGLGGLLSGGPELSAYGQQAQGYSQDAMNAYRNLVAQGPGAQDVQASLGASRDYASRLQGIASSGQGLYDMSAGQRLAELQYAPQRQALMQSLQDQMAVANRRASAAGRGSNDPILQARLGAQAMRQTGELNAQQLASSMELGRQFTADSLNLQGQQVNVLGGLSQQAYGNQMNMFTMANQAYQTEMQRRDSDAKNAGGGFMGFLTGALGGASAGLNLAQGIGGMNNAASVAGAQTNALNTWAKVAPQMASNMSTVAANLSAPPQMSAPRVGPSSWNALQNAGIAYQAPIGPQAPWTQPGYVPSPSVRNLPNAQPSPMWGPAR